MGTLLKIRTLLLKLILQIINYVLTPLRNFLVQTNKNIKQVIDRINDQEFVYFTKEDDVATLNKVMLYVRQNEHTRRIKVVACFSEGESATAQYLSDLDVVDREYPEIKIEFVQIQGEFGPQIIQDLSKKWNIPINFMFIGSPGDSFPYRIEELGGVRLII